MRIVLGNSSLIKYQQGGGHWSWFLQYPLGLKALQHDVFWLELLQSSGRREDDLRLIRDFFNRLALYDLDRDCAVLLFHADLAFQPSRRARHSGEAEQRSERSSTVLTCF